MTKDERHHAPSDLELMLYFDGELDDPRKSEVAAFVNADLRSRNKLAGLQMSSALVEAQAREMAAGPSPTRSPADDIANLVLAKIEAEGPFARTTSGDPSRTASADPPTAKVIPSPSATPRSPRDVQQIAPTRPPPPRSPAIAPALPARTPAASSASRPSRSRLLPPSRSGARQTAGSGATARRACRGDDARRPPRPR